MEHTRRPRFSAAAGVIAPVLFVATYSIDGWLRPGYDPASMFVSELSIGPGGWVQRLNFVVSGLLILAFAVGLGRSWRGTWHPRAVPVTLGLLGACLAASGWFTTDPSAMVSQTTVHGLVHGILGAVVFSCMPISCFLAAVRLRREGGRVLWWWTSVVGVVLVLLLALFKASDVAAGPLFDVKGLIQRALLTLYLGWLFAFALRRLRTTERQVTAPISSKATPPT